MVTIETATLRARNTMVKKDIMMVATIAIENTGVKGAVRGGGPMDVGTGSTMIE